MLAVQASCANEYAKKEEEKEKNTTFSANFMGVLLATMSDSSLKNMLIWLVTKDILYRDLLF